ncbi:SMP-30/gluconolactonase/LRE family protein, partial [bacterium]|nr:SMP-30/gluconolactonase/LRE family protein [bacterium]
MLRVLLLSLFILIFAIGCDNSENSSSPIQTGPTNLFVANTTTLSVINLESGDVSNDVFGLGNSPNDMTITGDLLIVVNSLSNDLNFFHISDDGTLSPDGVADVGVAQNNNPWAVAADAHGNLLITNYMQNSISVLSIEARTIEQTLPAGVAPEGIITADGFAYVVNSGYDFGTYTFNEGSVWKYNLDTWEIADSLQIGVNAQDIQMDPSGWLHVICTGDYAGVPGKVYIINPQTLSVHRIIEIGGTPNHVAFAPDMTAYLSAGGWAFAGAPAGIVLKYRYDTGELLRDSNNPIDAGNGANDIAILDDGRIFVSCFDDNCIDELRGDTVFTSYIVGTNPSAIL